MTRPLGVILAGGQSRRMGGGDKALLDLGGKPLVQHVIERLAPQVDTMVINANGEAARFAQTGLPVVPDSIKGFAGPLAGVLAGLDRAAQLGLDDIVTVAADTPFFPPDLVSRLVKTRDDQGTPIVLAATKDTARGLCRHPTFGLWPVSLREALRDAVLDGTRKVVAWTDAAGCTSALFSSKPVDRFFNINTPEDRAEALILMEKGLT